MMPGSDRFDRMEPGGVGRGLRALLGAAAVAAAVALTTACGADAQAGDARADRQATGDRGGSDGTSSRVVNVESLELTSVPFEEIVRVTGTAKAYRDVEVAAEETGVIRELPVEKGRRVRAGDVIARVDDRILRAEVEEARARANLARETWQRRKRLYEEQKAISELAYLEARYQAEEAGARLATLEERLDRTEIRAPVEGILEDRYVEVGTRVSPGSRVARIVDLDPVKVRGGVPERYARDVRTGSSVEVSFDVLPSRNFQGRLSFVGATVDPSSRTFPVELLVRNPSRSVKPEMVANVRITRGLRESAVVVPQEALVRREDGFAAFVIEEENGTPVAKLRRVVPGPSRQDMVVVESGLEAGDRLIVVGQHQVADGDRVKVVAERDDVEAPDA